MCVCVCVCVCDICVCVCVCMMCVCGRVCMWEGVYAYVHVCSHCLFVSNMTWCWYSYSLRLPFYTSQVPAGKLATSTCAYAINTF